MTDRHRFWIVWSTAWMLTSCGRIPEEAKPAAEPAPAQVQPAQPAPAPAQPVAAEPTPALAPDPILAASQEVPVSDQQDVPVPAELRIAMEELADALRARDPAGVLAKFSRQGFRHADTRRAKPAPQFIAFERVERELNAKKGDLYDLLFGASGVVQYVSGQHATTWAAVAADQFAPRRVDAKKVWLRFRLEGEAWHVDTLGYPATVRAR